MIGRTLMPGDFMSISKNEMPCCGRAFAAGAHQTEDPVGILTQRIPGFLPVDEVMIRTGATALVRSDARSEPEPGSEYPRPHPAPDLYRGEDKDH